MEKNKENTPLVTWHYSPEEWNTAITVARNLKKEDNYYYAFAILVGSIIVLMLTRDVSFLTALLFAIPFAVFIPYIRFKIVTKKLTPTKSDSFVVFYKNFINFNDTLIELYAENRWIKNMKIITENSINFIEVDIAWSTRRGNTFDEYRIPIPNEQLTKAEELINLYANQHQENS